MSPEPVPSAHELLSFYLEAGVDCALSEEPVNRLAETAPEPASPERAGLASPESGAAFETARAAGPALRAAALAPPPHPLAPAPDVAIETALALAPQAATLEELRALLENFEGCALKTTATQLVFADGNPQARIMFVGEAPGRDEDIAGLPFVGRSGRLLDRMLATIGLGRSDVYIANIIPWRPPGNRTPSPQETQMCLPFVKRQIELVDPDILVCLGKPSSQALLQLKDGIIKSRGRWHDYDTGTRTIRAMATFHPAYLLRSPIYKRLTWQDLRTVKTALRA